MIVLIDNYDSFVHNLARYVRRLGHATKVVRNDAVTVDDLRRWQPNALILSPGPCTPSEAGVCLEVVTQLSDTLPMLGICLGHQAIAQAFGGRIVRASQPMHGRGSLIQHNGQGLFRDLPSPLMVGRYHSLIVDKEAFPQTLAITATLADDTIMALEHQDLPIFGVQFHPESVLTSHGYEMLRNFFTAIGLSSNAPPEDERCAKPTNVYNAGPNADAFSPRHVPEAWMAHHSLTSDAPNISPRFGTSSPSTSRQDG